MIPTQPETPKRLPLPAGLEERLSAAIDRWEAAEKAARRRAKRRLWAGIGSVAAAAVVAGAFFLAPRTAPQLPKAPEVTQEAQPAVAEVPTATPATDVVYAPRAASVAKQPAAVPTTVPTARRAPAAPKQTAPAKPQNATQPPQPTTRPADVTPEEMQAVENLLAKRLEELRRQEQLIEELLRNYEETKHKQPYTI